MKNDYKPKYVKRILVDRKEVEEGIAKAARWINKKYSNSKQPIVVIGILRGAIPFYGRLVMRIKRPVYFEFVRLSSFRGGIKAAGKPEMLSKIEHNIKGRDVIVVEDVADTARTLSVLVKYLKSKKPKSVRTVVLANKPDMRVVNFKPDYVCFNFKGNPFLIGYGLDIAELARNLPYIAEFDKKYLNKL